ncbi:hypothetical protein GWK91_12910 [Virgibacillus sp. MSP4-1]|uniref:hypothetical protein n=1 Tax=Virgibacillus sp. MSP4-1 TaxID=2700081 RepID=UPI00039B8FB0|nr:hypothetical protein [Virgibacillus sp. MSP4-1]QHS23790.1 hypothetical protein GWK91_12910 [Virgibacillus sp. MSP4-1]
MFKWFKIVMLGTLVFLGACQSNEVAEEPYEGTPLKIAVVGEKPEVREEQIIFKTLSLEELYRSHSDKYDAVFIREEHFSDASHKKYVEMFKKKRVPSFFVASKANTIPFQDLENPISYKEAAKKINDTQNYISGFLYEGADEGYQGWKFSYPVKNSEIQRENVQGIYSTVFKVVEKEWNKASSIRG